MKIKYILILTFCISFEKNHALEVTVNSFPSTSEHVSIYGTGTLTQAKQAMQNPVGWAINEFEYSSTWEYSSPIPCCTDEDKVKVRIENSTIKTTINPTNTDIYVPTWINRTVNCSQAYNEWNRFESAVRSHENGHIDVFKQFLTVQKVKEYFDSSIETESACETDIQTAKDLADQDITTQLDVAGTWLNGGNSQAQDQFHASAPPISLDATQDCP